MSIAGSGGTLITPPICTPPRFSLLSTVEVEERSETQGHWQAGFASDLPSCEDLIAVTACPPLPEEKTDSLEGVLTQQGDPFTLVAGYTCSLGGRPISEAWDMADQRLSRGESRSVERMFWTGEDKDGNVVRGTLRYASDPDDPQGYVDAATDVTPTPGTAVAITDGVALLESYMGDCYPCSPIIHAQRGVATYMAERGLLEVTAAGLLLQATGTRLVPGGGYLTVGPDGEDAPAGTGWLFATGGVKVLRSPAFFTPDQGEEAAAIIRATNDIQVFAERTYGFVRDCCTAAILVTLQAASC